VLAAAAAAAVLRHKLLLLLLLLLLPGTLFCTEASGEWCRAAPYAN
jgi:hypothetical protein